MENFMNFMERAIVPIATKIGNNKYLLAIRDAFIGMLAITMVGSFAVLINNLSSVKQFAWFGDFMQSIFGANWRTLNGNIWFGTLCCLSIFLVFGLSNRLARNLGDDGFEAMLVAAASYFTLLPKLREMTITPEGSKEAIKHTTYGLVNWGGNFNGEGLFVAMIVAILATVIFVNLSKVKFMLIKLPDGVPPAVSKAFAKLIPGMATIFIIALLGLLFGLMMSPDGTYAGFDKVNSVKEQIMQWLAPGIKKIDSLPVLILIVFLNQALWCVGLHGSNILEGIIRPIMTSLATQNADLYAAGVAITSGDYNVVGGRFLDAFVYLGGSGATLGLLIAMIVFAKKKRAFAGVALPPGIFQINEPVLFGLPIVLNPVYFIPFIVGPIILAVISYLAISWGWVAPVVAVDIPWVAPVGLGGFLVTGGQWSGAVLAIFNFILSILIYAPFVIIGERIDSKQLAEAGKGIQA